MKIIVLKFGGTSVGSIERIKKAVSIIQRYIKKKYKVIVVSSAMSGVTNDLIRKSQKLSRNFIASEYDVLVSSGEQISCALISGRLTHLGYNSRYGLDGKSQSLLKAITKNLELPKYLKIKLLNTSKVVEYL